MNLRNFFSMASVNTLYWLITIPVVAIGAAVISLVAMSWVVTAAVIFDLALPLKVIAVSVGFTALTALVLASVFGRFKK